MPLPAPAEVEFDQACGRCGYNLRSQPVDGVCPECSAPVAASLRRELLALASTEFLRSVHLGLSLIFWGIILLLGVALATAVASMALSLHMALTRGPGAMMASQRWVGLVNALPILLLVVGYWKFSAPAPNLVGAEQSKTPRILLRVGIIVLLIGALGAAAGQFGTQTGISRMMTALMAARTTTAPAPAPTGPTAAPQESPLDDAGAAGVTPQEPDSTDAPATTAEPPPEPDEPEDSTPTTTDATTPAPASPGAQGASTLPPPPNPMAVLGSVPWGWIIVAIFFGLLTYVGWCIVFFAMMRYARWMAVRIPDEELEERAKMFTWLLPVIYLVGSCFIIGPLVAQALYCWMLWQLRARVGAILAARTGT